MPPLVYLHSGLVVRLQASRTPCRQWSPAQVLPPALSIGFRTEQDKRPWRDLNSSDSHETTERTLSGHEPLRLMPVLIPAGTSANIRRKQPYFSARLIDHVSPLPSSRTTQGCRYPVPISNSRQFLHVLKVSESCLEVPLCPRSWITCSPRCNNRAWTCRSSSLTWPPTLHIYSLARTSQPTPVKPFGPPLCSKWAKSVLVAAYTALERIGELGDPHQFESINAIDLIKATLRNDLAGLVLDPGTLDLVINGSLPRLLLREYALVHFAQMGKAWVPTRDGSLLVSEVHPNA